MIRSSEGEALTQLILETFRLNGELLDAGNRLTAPHGLTSARWQVLGAIDLADQPLTVSQIARRMGLARQGVQRMINQLEAIGIVIANPNQDHKRAPLFSISPAGAAIMVEINKAQTEWVNDLAQGMNEGTISAALTLLETMRERLDKSNN